MRLLKMPTNLTAAFIITILVLTSCSNGNTAKTNKELTGRKAETVAAEARADKQQDDKGSTENIEKSEKEQQTAVSLEAKQNAVKLFEQGNVLYNNGDYEGAIKILKQAVQADPENYQAYNVLGVSQAFLGLYGEADKNIDQAVKLNPSFANATFNKAISLKLQKKYDEAIKYFDITIKLNPNDVWSHYGKATIYSEREDVKNCVASLKTALEREPGVREAVMDEHEFDPVRKDPEFQKLMK